MVVNIFGHDTMMIVEVNMRASDSTDSDSGGPGGYPSTVLDSLLKAPDETA